MFADTLGFVSMALRSGVECSLEDLTALPEFQEQSRLELLNHLELFFEHHEIAVNPPLNSEDCEWNDVRVFSRTQQKNDFNYAFKQAIEGQEDHGTEYKQTLYLDVRRLENDPKAKRHDLVSRKVIHEVVKTIVGFLNADGGTLLIGVQDDQTIYGIENEFPYLPNGNSVDDWELFFRAQLQERIPDYRILQGYVNSGLVTSENGTVCVVEVKPRLERICVCTPHNAPQDELVYKRDGNQTLNLRPREVEALILQRNGLM